MSDQPLLTRAEALARECPVCQRANGNNCDPYIFGQWSIDYEDGPLIHVARAARARCTEGLPCTEPGCPNVGRVDLYWICAPHAEHFRKSIRWSWKARGQETKCPHANQRGGRAYGFIECVDCNAILLGAGPPDQLLAPAEVAAYFDGALAALRMSKERPVDDLIALFETALSVKL